MDMRRDLESGNKEKQNKIDSLYHEIEVLTD